MKAEVVHNKKGEPRLFVEFETDEERRLFKSTLSLDLCVTGWENDTGLEGEEVLTDMSFTFKHDPHPEYGPCDHFGPDKPTCAQCTEEDEGWEPGKFDR